VPKGAAYLLGPQTYEHILKENNFFLTTVATIPINMEYEAWFAVIDPNHQSDTELLSLYDHLICQTWFLHIKAVAKNKCLLVTMKSNLPDARAWIDANLERLIRKSIPPDIDPPLHLLLWHLNKLVYLVTSQTYADILKKQFSLALMTQTMDTNNNQPPHKRQAKICVYASNHSTGSPTATPTPNSSTCSLLPLVTTTAAMVDYTAELMSLKTELQSLCMLITMAVAHPKTEIASLHATQTSHDMETNEENSQTATSPHPTANELSNLIAELRHDIATTGILGYVSKASNSTNAPQPKVCIHHLK